MKEDTFTIHYPSGNLLTVFARFIGMKRLEDSWCLCIDLLETKVFNGQVLSAGSLMVIDPRCVILDANGNIEYTPRPNISKMDTNFQEWLHNNADWPERLNKK